MDLTEALHDEATASQAPPADLSVYKYDTLASQVARFLSKSRRGELQDYLVLVKQAVMLGGAEAGGGCTWLEATSTFADFDFSQGEGLGLVLVNFKVGLGSGAAPSSSSSPCLHSFFTPRRMPGHVWSETGAGGVSL